MIGGDWLICLVTDRRRLAGGATAAAPGRLAGGRGAAGVDLIQVRERDLDARALAELVARCVHATAGTAPGRGQRSRRRGAGGRAAGVHCGETRRRCGEVRACAARVPDWPIRAWRGRGGRPGRRRGAGLPRVRHRLSSASKDCEHPVAGRGGLKRLVRHVKSRCWPSAASRWGMRARRPERARPASRPSACCGLSRTAITMANSRGTPWACVACLTPRNGPLNMTNPL